MAIEPGKLPPMTTEEVMARAQRILDLRGRPPYSNNSVPLIKDGVNLEWHPFWYLSEDELALLSEFMIHWLPFLVEKEKR